MMRIRVEGDAQKLVDFMTSHNYPYQEGNWTKESLQKYSIMVRLEDWDGLIATTFGFMWATWVDGARSTLDFHAIVIPEYRLKWFSLFPDLEKLAGFLGASTIYTKTPGDPKCAELTRLFLIRRLGFKRHDDGAVYKSIG